MSRPRKKQVADKTESFYTSNLTPPNGRQIIIAVDQVNIRPGSLRPVLDAAGRFLDLLSPLDQVAFVAFPEPGPRVNFTNDKLRLHTSDAGAGRTAAARQGRELQHRRVGSDLDRRASRSDRPRGSAHQGVPISSIRDRSRSANATSSPSRRRLPGTRVRTPTSRFASCSAARATGVRRWSEVAHSDLRGARGFRDQRSATPRSTGGAARTAINVLSVDLRRGDVTIAEQPPTEAEDRRILMQGLEAIASMSRGSLYHIAGTGEPIFERLASETSAYYLLGVEQRPSDSVGDRHRIDVEVRRNDVTIRSRQAFVLSPSRTARRSPQEILRDALGSPFAISGLASSRDHVSRSRIRRARKSACDRGADRRGGRRSRASSPSGTSSSTTRTGLPLRFGDEVALTPGAGSPNEPLKFVGGVVVDPGLYSLRLGVVDSEGRRGSIVRDVSAWKMAGETFALGDLIVGGIPTQGTGSYRAGRAVRPDRRRCRVSRTLLDHRADVEWHDRHLRGCRRSRLAAVDLAARIGGPRSTANVARGVRRNRREDASARALRRAREDRARRPSRRCACEAIRLRARGSAAPAGSVAVAAAAVSFASSLPKFDSAAVLRRRWSATMLDMVERRSPDLKEALTEARAGRYGPAALEAFTAGDQTVAAFLRGIDLFTKGQPDQAATQLSDFGRSTPRVLPGRVLSGSSVCRRRPRSGCRRRMAAGARH